MSNRHSIDKAEQAHDEHTHDRHAKPYHDEEHQHRGFWGNVKWQLDTWHGGRGDKSFLMAMIPTPTNIRRHEDMPKNPFKVLQRMSLLGYAAFFTGWLCWMCDGYDYFSVPITVTDLEHYFDRPAKDVTWALTVTTLCRVVGALLFGFMGDRYGRRYTLCVNMLCIMAFELGSGFVQTYHQFLGVRAAFGIIMGGTWPLAVATALENVPVEARGIVSGLVQQGYAMGYLLAAVIGLTVAQDSPHTWRTLYWFGAGFSFLGAIVRFCLPESKLFLEARQQSKEEGVTEGQAAAHMARETMSMLRINWIRCVWCVVVMAGFCFLAHGSQDMYPTYLKTTKGLSPQQANKVVIISNCGAVAGGILGGSLSSYFGRRFAIILSILWTAAFIPLWILPKSFGGLAAGGFFMQWGVQSAWGVVPVYLSEVSPPAFRAIFLGFFYQLGNMASAGSGQIEATVASRVKIPGTDIPDYARIQGVFIGIVLAVTITCIIVGPEADASHFERSKVAYQTGAGEEFGARLVDEEHPHSRRGSRKSAA